MTMTAQLLTSELSTLIQESKRKYPELKTAAEKSLNDLKSVSQASETQLSADLRCRPNFATPFLLACGTRNPKFASSAIVCLQRLIVSKGLSDQILEAVLEALRQCSSLALDIQLKVLQALPSLLQNYASKLRGKLLVNAFQLCFLLHNSKTAVISHTAAAALQQLVASTFEKVVAEDGVTLGDASSTQVWTDNGAISVRESALDAYQLLDDICLMTEGQSPKVLSSATLSQNFGLELLESILSDYAETLKVHPEQVHVCRTRLVPLITRVLSERVSFSTTVRVMRLVQLIIGNLLSALATECEMVLSLLNHMLDPDAAVLWKRALSLEVFKGIHYDSALIRSIYFLFDEQEEKRNVVRDHLATLVRLASEKPATIGLGNQSTVPITNPPPRDGPGEEAAIQADGLIGSIGAAVSLTEPEAPGISTRWSSLRVPCIDQLDKSEAPVIPAAYIYGLALTCINNFSEGLAKFLLPYTLPVEMKIKKKFKPARRSEESMEASATSENLAAPNIGRRELARVQSIRSRKLPVNPLKLEDHAMYGEICTSGQMVENCWPAILAACSTFLNATLDSDYYHALIRSFQRFTQVAGLLDLTTPRDAFLTTLGKHSLPSAGMPSLTSGNSRNSPVAGSLENTDNLNDEDRVLSPSPRILSVRKRSTVDPGAILMNTRNLLCLRALLNLGIALGPVLNSSWLIILETLQHADLVISYAEAGRRQSSGQLKQSSTAQTITEGAIMGNDFTTEVAAVKTAAARMFEATSDLPDPAFMNILQCLCNLLQISISESSEPPTDDLLSPKVLARKHDRLPSLTRLSLDGALAIQGNVFVLTRLSEMVTHNILRLVRVNTAESGWDLLVEVLTHLLGQPHSSPELRIKATSVLSDLCLEVATSPNDSSPEEQDIIRKRGLVALLGGISCLRLAQRLNSRSSQSCDFEIHKAIIETSRSILEQCGESLVLGWDTVFAIIMSTFDNSVSGDANISDVKRNYISTSSKILRSSFGPLQLICSDFTSSVPHSCGLMLLETMYAFSSQQQDLNISLTTITFFQNVSDFLHGESANMDFDSCITSCRSELDLINIIKVEHHSRSNSTLWLCLLLRLMRIANDVRLEVRHSALHTLFRIFDTCSEKLSRPAWRMCYRVVLVEMLRIEKETYDKLEHAESPNQNDETREGRNETAVIMIGGVSKLLSQNLESMISSPNFSEIWSQLLVYFSGLLKRKVLEISTAVFIGVSKILTEIEDIGKLDQSSTAKLWDLWEGGIPVSHRDNSQRKKGNQDSVIAYLELLHQMSRFIGHGIELEQVKIVTERLHSCVVNSDSAAYSVDIDRLSPVQKSALNSLKNIPTEIPGALYKLVDSIAGFIILAYEGDETKSQSYVALSKAAMDLLRTCLVDHMTNGKIGDPKLVTRALDALKIPLRLKYHWRREGKEPSPWKKATTTSLTILEAILPILKPAPDAPDFWSAIIEVSAYITSADTDSCNNPASIPQDQKFDIAAHTRMRELITPLLGLSSVPEPSLRDYAASIFSNSIIHSPHPDDLARPGQDLLQGLQSIHIGRTQDLPPTPRSELSYLLLDELFSLVSATVRESTSSSEQQQLRLARAAAPFLILRAGITIKAYTHDQPLRGRMPQPWSQKKELLYILRKLVELNSEPGAIHDAPGITSPRKKHLHRLYRLVVQAIGITTDGDDEVKEGLQDFLKVLGEDFGI